MKTIREFSKDSIWALDRLDGEDLKNAVCRRKKKSSFLSAREQEIKDLKNKSLSCGGVK